MPLFDRRWFLFAEIEIGPSAHDTTARLLALAPVTQRELSRLERGLDWLRQAIDGCSQEDGRT